MHLRSQAASPEARNYDETAPIVSRGREVEGKVPILGLSALGPKLAARNQAKRGPEPRLGGGGVLEVVGFRVEVLGFGVLGVFRLQGLGSRFWGFEVLGFGGFYALGFRFYRH